MKNIVFITKTPLAGAPIRIANAINEYSDYKVRVVNLNPNQYGNRTFQEDLVWDVDKEICIDLIKNADILHFHHYMDLIDNDFKINFKKIIKPECKIIIHFHSDKNCVKNWGINIDSISQKDYTKVVIPHYPERTFLEYRQLPNIIPINNELLLPHKNEKQSVTVVFSTSFKNSFLDDRFQTKGFKEVHGLLKKLSKKYKFKYELLCDTPYEKAMKIKQNADIIVGDIVTGSYHLTELESLSQGKVVLTKLDGRTIHNSINLLKCDELPFVNTNLITLEPILSKLVADNVLRKEIGDFSRLWIEKFYSDELLVKFFIELYEDVLKGKEVKRKNFEDFKLATDFLYRQVYNYEWEVIRQKAKWYNFKQKVKRIFSVKKEEINYKKRFVILILGMKITFKISRKY